MSESKGAFADVIAEEKALITLLENQRAAIFNIATNISGSGEWHRYYRRDLTRHIDHSKLRIRQMSGMQ